jgi:hypothetical protein
MEERINAITLELSRINGELIEAKQEITSLKNRLSVSEAKNKVLMAENKKLINDEIPETRNVNISTENPNYSDVCGSDEEIRALIDNDRGNDFNQRRLSLHFGSSSPSVSFSPLVGIRDTLSIFTPSSILTKEKKENELRKLAYDGKADKISKMLNEDQTLVNGRGMPDSICSRVSFFYDKTALMLAAKQGNLSCVKELILHDADPNLWDRDKLTALDYSERAGHVEVSSYLRTNNALNAVNVPELKEELTNRFKLS